MASPAPCNVRKKDTLLTSNEGKLLYDIYMVLSIAGMIALVIGVGLIVGLYTNLTATVIGIIALIVGAVIAVVGFVLARKAVEGTSCP